MICRTLRPRSAWSCEINMFWDTDQATTFTMRAGAKSRLSCARQKASRPSLFTPKPATTPRRTELRHHSRFPFLTSTTLSLALLFLAGPLLAQIPVDTPPPPPPPDESQTGSHIKLQVNLVVLHTTVLDDRGKFVEGLGQDNFRVYEDKVEQK